LGQDLLFRDEGTVDVGEHERNLVAFSQLTLRVSTSRATAMRGRRASGARRPPTARGCRRHSWENVSADGSPLHRGLAVPPANTPRYCPPAGTMSRLLSCSRRAASRNLCPVPC